MADLEGSPGTATSGSTIGRGITAVLIVGPVVAVAVAVPLLWGHAVHLRDIILAVILYAVTGHGVTVGFHRMFTHRGFTPNRGLKIALALAGSMAMEGSVTGWVANHRRHHVYSDQPGDPHSPYFGATGEELRPVRGFVHAHVGWLFGTDTTSAKRFAPDLLRDRDISIISRLFPLLAVISLSLPLLIGYALSHTLEGAFTAFLWAGLVRMALLHHVTWSVNSVCHMVGRRPFATSDKSRNVSALAFLSMGESWHNLHHAYPASARHGALRRQMDSSARLIWLFEKAGWATKVRWPTAERLAALMAPAPPQVALAA